MPRIVNDAGVVMNTSDEKASEILAGGTTLGYGWKLDEPEKKPAGKRATSKAAKADDD